MRYKRDRDVVYRSGFLLGVGSLVIFAWSSSVLGAARSGSEGALFIGALGFLIIPLVFISCLRPKVALTDSQVQIFGALFIETIPYESISDALFTGEAFGRRWLEVHRTIGGIVGVHPFSGAVPGMAPLWQRPHAVELIERVDEARSGVRDE